MIRLTRNNYEPDICFWRKEQSIHFKPKQSVFPPPDFVVEILSDSTLERDYGIKMPDYALHGIAEYWIIDSNAHSIEQYFLKENTYELNLKIKEGSIETEVIKGFKMNVNEIFESK